MVFALWSSSYETGHPDVDLQHQRLFALVNELHEAMGRGQGKAVLGPVLRELADYTLAHFATEEALMQASGYPELARHQRLHADLARDVEEYLARFHAGYFTLPTTLSRFLADWLKHHIRTEDHAFVAWLKRP